MKRANLSPSEKLAMCERQNWCCAICELPFGTEMVEFDHEIPHALRPGEKPSQAVHRSCHRIKSRAQLPQIKKAIRTHRKLVLREKRRTRKILSGGFDKRWRKRMNGETVRREA